MQKSIEERDKFRDLIRIEDDEEAKHIKGLIRLFINKKRDYKFVIVPTFNSLLDLCGEFVLKVQPMIRYIILRLDEQGRKEYCTRWRELLHSIPTQEMSKYYTFLNSSNYAKSIYYKKLMKVMIQEEQKIHAMILLVYALCPYKDKPLRQDTVGVSTTEYEEMFEE